jgi:hypothetical protein
MAKHYPQTLWDAIRAYWENSNASFLDAAKAVAKGEDSPNKSAISSKAKIQGWVKKYSNEEHKISDVSDGSSNKTDGTDKASDSGQTLANINSKAKRKADIRQAKSDGLADVITQNVHLSQAEIDELCVDFRVEVLQKHRGDFTEANNVVNLCIQLFRKAMDIILDGGYVVDGDIVEKNGYVHQNLKQNLYLAEFTIKAMLNAAGVKNIAQTNERKAYGLDTYEEPNSGGDLAKKALSQTGMGNHYERIRLGKPDEKMLLRGRLKDKV